MKKHGLKTLLFLTLFSALALAQDNREEFNPGSKKQIQQQIQQQEQKQKWFEKGDMYEWRNKKAPLKILIQTDGLWEYLDDYDSLCIIRDDSVFEARIFREGREQYPPYKVDKGYIKRISDEYLRGWFEQTNRLLDYLSGGKFQLELEGIERVPGDSLWQHTGKVYTMIVYPHGGPMSGGGGYYSGNGIFWIDPLSLTYDKTDESKCTIVPIHEILHSFFGIGHSPDSMSTIYSPSFHIYLTEQESKFLGWPKIKPKKLEKIEL